MSQFFCGYRLEMFKCQTKYFVCIVHELKINLRMYTSVCIREFCKAICDIKLMLYMYLSISCIHQNLQKRKVQQNSIDMNSKQVA